MVNQVTKPFKKLKDKLKANTSSVTSELGGGINGHLVLVLTPDEYTKTSEVPYEKPRHPGQLRIQEEAPLHEAIRLKMEYKDKIKLF